MSEQNWGNPQAVQSNWFKFEKVGDKIKGTLLSKELVKSNNPNYDDQYVYVLKTEEGDVNVGISVKKSGTVGRLNKCKIGEIVGIVFESETESKTKGFHPTKNLTVWTWGMDKDYNVEEVDAEGFPVTEKVNSPFNN